MIKTLVAAIAFTVGVAGYAVAQEAAPAAPAAPTESNLPPHHPLRHLPPHHPLRRHRPPNHPTLQHASADRSSADAVAIGPRPRGVQKGQI
jgi:hypothetical protein